VGILIVALVAFILLCVLLMIDTSAVVTFSLPLLHKKYDVGVWLFFFVTVIVTAFVAWILHLLSERQLKQRMVERQNELSEVKDRLRRAENNLAAHESRIHEFTLQVLQLTRAPLPASPPPPSQMVFEETNEPSALNPAPPVSPPSSSETQTVPKVPEPQETI